MTAEESAFIEALYLQMYDRLLAYARSSLQGNAQAEEAVQETFRIACLKSQALCTCQCPEGWLINTLRNVIANIHDHRRCAVRLLKGLVLKPDHVNIEQLVDMEAIYGDLVRRDEFKLLWEMAVEGKSVLEMAQKRGISVAACKKRVERAKKYLKKKI